MQVSVSLVSTLRNLLIAYGKNSHKKLIFLKKRMELKFRDKNAVLDVLKKNGMILTTGAESRLALQKKSPLEPATFNKKLPYVYLGFNTIGKLYIGVNVSNHAY